MAGTCYGVSLRLAPRPYGPHKGPAGLSWEFCNGHTILRLLYIYSHHTLPYILFYIFLLYILISEGHGEHMLLLMTLYIAQLIIISPINSNLLWDVIHSKKFHWLLFSSFSLPFLCITNIFIHAYLEICQPLLIFIYRHTV